MIDITNFINEKLKVSSKSKINQNTYSYYPKDKDELEEIVNKLIKERGENADLNDIDTSKITDMSHIFKYSPFNGNISSWDVSNVKNMRVMFAFSKFNGDISHWDVSNVKDMHWIFYCSPLENNPPKWYHE